jgi:flagellar protein FliS
MVAHRNAFRTFGSLLRRHPAADTQAVNASQVYRQTQTQTAGPGELVLMLYRGAVRFLTAAIDAIDAHNVAQAHDKLVKTQDIIANLLETLDVERGGEVARNLSALYEYMLRRLLEANVRKDAAPAREVQTLLRELLPAWEAAVRQTSATATGTLVGAAR